MKRALALLVAAPLVALALTAAPNGSLNVTPAAEVTVAHPGTGPHFDSLSFFTCGATKGVLTTIQSDWPYYLSAEVVGYSCAGHSHETGVVCTWRAQHWWNDVITSEPKSCSGF